MLKTLISPSYLLNNTHICHIAPLFIPKASKLKKGGNNMDNNSEEQFLIIQARVESNKQDTDEKLTQIT